MSRHYKIATVFGGTGFIGRHVVSNLASRGIRVKVATRVPERAYFLKPCGAVGQIVPFAVDYSDLKSIENAVSDSDFVVNCVGILAEKGKATFQAVHTDFPSRIAKACAKENVKRFVHISALGSQDGTSEYAKSKKKGEEGVRTHFPHVSILRPSIVFGEEDNFFNMFAKMSLIAPALPLIGGGHTKFQPVFVGDVADAVMACIYTDAPQAPSKRAEKTSVPPSQKYTGACGHIYELGGPEVASFKELFKTMFMYTRRPRPLISLPFPLAKIQAGLMKILPNPPLTPDQVESLKTDNIINKDAKTLEDLGLTPTPMDMVLPRYLERYRSGGRFADVKPRKIA